MLRSTLFFALTLSVLMSGCGSAKPKGHLPVFAVTGAVTYKGKPVVGADVTFFNEAAKKSSFGRTNDQGEYKLTTYAANDGATEGKQIVTISKVDIPEPTKPLAGVESPDYAPPGANQSTDPVKPKSVIPAKYASQTTSGLVAVVNATGDNTCNFDLVD